MTVLKTAPRRPRTPPRRSAAPRRAATPRRGSKAWHAARRRERQIRALTILAAVGVAGVLVGIAVIPPPRAELPTLSTIVVDPATVTDFGAVGYDAEQLHNAAVIVDAGADLGLGARDQTIGVMTAIGESSLRNIDYGDWETSRQRNPDGTPTSSIGLFQQQDWWATRDVRLDPHASATLFFQAMLRKVPDPARTDTEPTIVAHRTQINEDPQHYARYWNDAVRIVAALYERGQD